MKAILIAATLLAAQGVAPAMAQPSLPSGIFERFTMIEGLSIQSTGDQRGPQGESHKKIMLEWADHALEINGADIVFEETGTTLKLDNVLVSHQDVGGGVVRLENVEIIMGPNALGGGQDAAMGCGYITDLVSVKIGIARLVPGVRAGFGHSAVEARNLVMVPDPDTRCFELELQADSLIGTRDSGHIWNLSDVDVGIDFPKTRLEAETGKEISRITFSAGRAAFQFPDAMRYLTLNDASLDIQVVSQDLAPAFLSFDPNLFLSPSWRETSIMLDVWNIAMLSQGRMDILVNNAQILATHIVPTYLTANFRNAGLTSIPVSVDTRVELNRGQVDLASMLHLPGMVDVVLTSRMDGLLFGRDTLTLADRGGITMKEVWPDLTISEFRMTWLDQGLQSHFINLLGLPAGSWFERFSEQQGIQFSEGFTKLFSDYPPIASRFFRAAVNGREIVIISRATGAPRLSEVLSATALGSRQVGRIFPIEYE